MRLTIAAIGKARNSPLRAAIEDYAGRARDLAPHLGLSGPDIIEVEAPAALKGVKRRAREGALLVKSTEDDSPLILLDETGKNLSSRELAGLISAYRDDGARGLRFAIGGADGHGAEIDARAARRLSLGANTWPHLLARLMLAEQLYRAMTILAGHPYHRD